ncbi:PEGA domain-containing protein [Patescibacteria group bacterium]|nr:PEGA domain-containing protein [Patescibacteria group bacterium]
MKKFLNIFYSKSDRIIGLVIVFIITILVILWAQGYRFNFSNYTVSQTGILRINTTPSNASLYLNNKYIGKSPLVVKSLIPKTYNLNVYLPNYITWDSLVSVNSQNITNVDAFLLPNIIKQNVFKTIGTVESVQMSDNNYLFVITKLGGVFKLYYYNLNSLTSGVPSLTEHYLFNLSNKIGFANLPIKIYSNSNFTYLAINYNGKYYLYNVVNNSITLLNKMFNFNGNITKIQWVGNNHLSIENNNLLAILDLSTEQMFLITFNSSYHTNSAIFNGNLIYSEYDKLTNTSRIFSINSDGSNKKYLFTIKGLIKNILASNSASGYIALSTNHHNYLYSASNNTIKSFDNGFTLIKFSPDSKYILGVNNLNLVAYYISNNSNITLSNMFNNLYDVMWYPLGGYIVYEGKVPNAVYNLYSLNIETVNASNNVTLLKKLSGTYYIVSGGNYLVALIYNAKYKSNLLYEINLIKNQSLLPFAL